MKTMFRIWSILAVAAGILLAGCSQQGGNTPEAGQQALGRLTPSPSLARMQGRSQVFASLPDRGNLLEYEAGTVARQRGAYTWYPVNLSEEHALRAVASGVLRITTPNGRVVALSYERHVEHPDGNWTWIGRDAAGQDAVLTFGDLAAFGTVPNDGELPLRLTMRDGRPWIVAVDRKRLAALDISATRPTKSDVLLPPLGARRAGAPALAPPSSSAAIVSAATPTATPTLDVALGYTTGFAAELGGQSQAITRLNNLVEIANQAFANSQLSGRIRLVRTLQVDYPDATGNQSALEDLTGYRNGSSIPVPASLQPLRAARESSGADLVSLVRTFRTPENEGCGVAWLLGFRQQPVSQAWAEFGYSVVSDGSDYNETKAGNYYCRDETLAHELGHNLGSAHDRETAMEDDGVLDPDDYGRYPYSFGHKTAAGAGNFFTVMAYGDSGQTTYRVFSNPRTTYCGGWPCGVPDQNDNARSLELMIPVIAQFRATVVGTFVDVPPDHWAYSQIERLFSAGISVGCSASPRMYCPSNLTLRDEMAVFLLRAKYGGTYQPPVATGVFSDVPASYWAAPWIERLRAEGITTGCQSTPLSYCPGSPVTRDQMALFLLRAKHGASYVPPPATGVFADVPRSYWAAAWIEQLAAEGITQGCSSQPLNFCPSDAVTRDQMAVFLVRAFSL